MDLSISLSSCLPSNQHRNSSWSTTTTTTTTTATATAASNDYIVSPTDASATAIRSNYPSQFSIRYLDLLPHGPHHNHDHPSQLPNNTNQPFQVGHGLITTKNELIDLSPTISLSPTGMKSSTHKSTSTRRPSSINSIRTIDVNEVPNTAKSSCPTHDSYMSGQIYRNDDDNNNSNNNNNSSIELIEVPSHNNSHSKYKYNDCATSPDDRDSPPLGSLKRGRYHDAERIIEQHDGDGDVDGDDDYEDEDQEEIYTTTKYSYGVDQGALLARSYNHNVNSSSFTRKKLRLSREQSALLEESFKLHSTLNPKQKNGLARQLGLSPRQVEVWFQNRRARTKLKQTEADCELLKRCCESLTLENRRLRAEVAELRKRRRHRGSGSAAAQDEGGEGEAAIHLVTCAACEHHRIGAPPIPDARTERQKLSAASCGGMNDGGGKCSNFECGTGVTPPAAVSVGDSSPRLPGQQQQQQRLLLLFQPPPPPPEEEEEAAAAAASSCASTA